MTVLSLHVHDCVELTTINFYVRCAPQGCRPDNVVISHFLGGGGPPQPTGTCVPGVTFAAPVSRAPHVGVSMLCPPACTLQVVHFCAVFGLAGYVCLLWDASCA